MNQFRKALIAVAGLLTQVVAVGVLEGKAQAWAQVALAAVTALTVYLVPNEVPHA